MAIKVQCACGAAYDVPEEWAGRKARCKRCQSFLTIPRPEEEIVEDFEVVDEVSPESTGAAAALDEVLDEVEVVEDAESSSAATKAVKPSGGVPAGKGEARRRKPKNKRRLSPEAQRLREADEQHRREEVRRGLAYLSSGVFTIIAGVAFTVLMASSKKAGELEALGGIFRRLDEIAGIWGPLIIGLVLGLFPCVIGILNLLGVGIVVSSEDDD
jgi:hypothetical protein